MNLSDSGLTQMAQDVDFDRSPYRITDTNIVYQVPQRPGQGPDCIWDGSPTRRAGSCWVCPTCGESTSC